MKATILDLRYRMKDVLRAIERGEAVTVLHRGKEKAMISPLSIEKPARPLKDHPAVRMWKDRDDMKDPTASVRTLRKPRFRDL